MATIRTRRFWPDKPRSHRKRHTPTDALRFRCASTTALACGIVAILTVTAPAGRACTVPVFRYALENWPADPYRALVFHRGKLDPADQAIVDWLEEQASAEGAQVNCLVRCIDLALESDQASQTRPTTTTAATLPRLVLRYPAITRVNVDLWAGPLSKPAAARLIHSPARREIAKRLLDGEAIVWVLLASGDRAKDDAAAALLQRELKRLHELIELMPDFDEPVGFEQDGTAPEPNESEPNAVTGPLRPRFSVVRVSRDDPQEALFVRMLLRSESDLMTFTEPMAFPMFGRGRVLYALVGKGINVETIEGAVAFLTSPCSCQVKAMNPGLDMLMAFDWLAALEVLATQPSSDPMVARLSGLTPRAPTSAPATTAPASPADGKETGLLLRSILATLGVILVLAMGAFLVLRRWLAQD